MVWMIALSFDLLISYNPGPSLEGCINSRSDMQTISKPTITKLDFKNSGSYWRTLVIEPLAEEIQIDSETEYRIEAQENEFYLEFHPAQIVIYLQRSAGFLLFKRPASQMASNAREWILVNDCSMF